MVSLQIATNWKPLVSSFSMVEPKKSLSRASVWFVHPGLLLKYAGLCEGGHPPSVDLRKLNPRYLSPFTISKSSKLSVVWFCLTNNPKPKIFSLQAQKSKKCNKSSKPSWFAVSLCSAVPPLSERTETGEKLKSSLYLNTQYVISVTWHLWIKTTVATWDDEISLGLNICWIHLG